MSLSVPNTAKAVLIGASNFPKDDTLSPIDQANPNIKLIAEVLANPNVMGIQAENITKMLDVADNTKIKEEVSVAAEEAKGALIVYITGHITTRKGHLYLATPNSSRKKIHINGIALDELLDIISETNAENRILIFDAYYSDVNDEETDGDVVIDALKYYESAYLNTFILSASPAANFTAFQGEGSETTFTTALTHVLNNGLDKEQESLSLVDIYEGLKDQMAGQKPVKSTATKADTIILAHNTKFLGFNELKVKGDQLFDKELFQEALGVYEDAAKLFGKNSSVKKRKKFIKRFLEGEKAVEKGNFEKAKDAFLEASAIFEMKVVTEKINGVLMTIANTLFDKEEYEAARENYKMVANHLPNDNFVKERLEKCDHELRFLDLIDEADKYYFDDNFEQALPFYEQALEIHSDRKAAKRREECQRLITKAAAIRKKIEAEQGGTAQLSKEELTKREEKLRKSVEEEIKAKLEKEFLVKLEQEKRELQSKQEQQKLKVAAKYDETLWTNISSANSLDVYEFFLQYYPTSTFASQAKERLEQLSTIVRKQKQKAEAQQASTTKPTTEAKKEEKPSADTEENAKKHKPFIKEEKGRSHVSEEKPYNILEELEAQFNGDGTTKHQKIEKKTPKIDSSEKAESPEDLINKVMNRNYTDKPEEKKAEVKKEVIPPKKEVTPPKEEKKPEPVVETKKTVVTPPEVKIEAPKQEEKKEIEKTPKPVEEEKKQYSEEELWQNAVEANSIDGYRFYVDNTKESEHLVDAYYQINKLSKMADAGVLETTKDDDPVAEKKEEIKVDSVVETKKETPIVSKVTPPTTIKTETTVPTPEDKSEEGLWQKAVEINTVNAYYEYVANSTEKKHLEEAKDKINSLKENARESEKSDWDKAESENTIDGYKTYIKNYPLGHYYAKAMFRISELEAQQ